MNKTLVAVGAAAVIGVGGAVAPSAQAAPSAPEYSNYVIKQAIKRAWASQSYTNRSLICRGFYVAPRRIVNSISRPVVRVGVAPGWQVKPLVWRFLDRKC